MKDLKFGGGFPGLHLGTADPWEGQFGMESMGCVRIVSFPFSEFVGLANSWGAVFY